MTACDPKQPLAETKNFPETSLVRSALAALYCVWATNVAFACGDPGFVSEAYYSAVVAGDYSASAKLFHPDAMSNQRSRLSFLFETEDGNLDLFTQIFGEGTDPSDVRAMTDQEFFELLHGLVTENTTAGELMHLTKYKIVGTVMENNLLAHVLVRVHTTLTLEGRSNPVAKNKADVYFDVQSMRCQDGKWMIEKDDNVEGFVSTLQSVNDLNNGRGSSDSTSH